MLPNQVDGFGAPTPGPQALADAVGIAPREGSVLMDDGRFLDAGKAVRWPAGVHSQFFGEAVYLTRTGVWVHFTPASFLDPPKATQVTPGQALAFVLREGFDVPPQLREVARRLEV
jgi:hypothetical protein